MLEQLKIERATGNGKYGDVLDVAEALADGNYGTSPNALAVMVRQSPLFQETLTKLKAVDSVPTPPTQP